MYLGAHVQLEVVTFAPQRDDDRGAKMIGSGKQKIIGSKDGTGWMVVLILQTPAPGRRRKVYAITRETSSIEIYVDVLAMIKGGSHKRYASGYGRE